MNRIFLFVMTVASSLFYCNHLSFAFEKNLHHFNFSGNIGSVSAKYDYSKAIPDTTMLIEAKIVLPNCVSTSVPEGYSINQLEMNSTDIEIRDRNTICKVSYASDNSIIIEKVFWCNVAKKLYPKIVTAKLYYTIGNKEMNSPFEIPLVNQDLPSILIEPSNDLLLPWGEANKFQIKIINNLLYNITIEPNIFYNDAYFSHNILKNNPINKNDTGFCIIEFQANNKFTSLINIRAGFYKDFTINIKVLDQFGRFIGSKDVKPKVLIFPTYILLLISSSIGGLLGYFIRTIVISDQQNTEPNTPEASTPTPNTNSIKHNHTRGAKHIFKESITAIIAALVAYVICNQAGIGIMFNDGGIKLDSNTIPAAIIIGLLAGTSSIGFLKKLLNKFNRIFG